MTPEEQKENARSIASILGIADDEAAERLECHIQITWEAQDIAGKIVGEFVQAMLERTFLDVGTTSHVSEMASTELVINRARSISHARRKIYCCIDASYFYCGANAKEQTQSEAAVPTILCLISACLAAAQVANYALELPPGLVHSDGVNLDFQTWPGVALSTWDKETDLGKFQVIGAGAVGNAFMYALKHLPVVGDAVIIDPKLVTSGILNRCLWFSPDDVAKPKAEILAKKANELNLGVLCHPFHGTAQEARSTIGEFNCLVVGVDSRRARRNLQNEVPYEVFDASTTGVEEIVFHSNRQFSKYACMACIYRETEREREFVAHLAETLNVSESDIAQGLITNDSAQKIIQKYPQLKAEEILGTAFDSLFRQLCATQSLRTAEEKQVLAPFAFVSQLAGTVLAIEMFLRRNDVRRQDIFNYWRVNPWRGAHSDHQQMKAMLPQCSICSRSDYQQLATFLWRSTHVNE